MDEKLCVRLGSWVAESPLAERLRLGAATELDVLEVRLGGGGSMGPKALEKEPSRLGGGGFGLEALAVRP